MICVHCKEHLTAGESRICVARNLVGGLCVPGHVVNFAGEGPAVRGLRLNLEIQTAEHEVVVAMREQKRVQRQCGRPDFDAAVERTDAALAAVDALLSPLPIRECFDGRYLNRWRGSNSADTRPGHIIELQWADCLRWVADNPDLDYRVLAGELEARK